MTTERQALQRHLETGLNRYAIITGSVELLFVAFDSPELQRAISRVISGGKLETEWKEYARFASVGGQEQIWWQTPIPEIKPHRETLIWWLVGETLNWFVASLDYYMAEILQRHFTTDVTTGNAWDLFERTTGLDLVKIKHGDYVYTTIQERHKVEHNRSIVDQRFLQRFAAKGIAHPYTAGTQIEKGHFDVTRAFECFEEFATLLDAQVEKVLAARSPKPRP